MFTKFKKFIFATTVLILGSVSAVCATQPEASKVVVIGPRNVGKTALINRLLERQDPLATEVTVAINGHRLNLADPLTGAGYPISLWDIPGQNEYKDMGTMFSRDAVVALLVTSNGIEDVEKGHNTLFASISGVSDVAATLPDAKFVLIASKQDLFPLLPGLFANVTGPDGQALEVILTSAKTGLGFEDLRASIVKNLKAAGVKSVQASTAANQSGCVSFGDEAPVEKPCC